MTARFGLVTWDKALETGAARRAFRLFGKAGEQNWGRMALAMREPPL